MIKKVKKETWNLSGKILLKERITSEIERKEIVTKGKNGKDRTEFVDEVLSTKKKVILELPLRRVSKEELMKIRKGDKPGFILKLEDELYYAELLEKAKFVGRTLMQEVHKCGNYCKRLSAKPTSEGGCDKVCCKSTGIENFEFIFIGYETINTDQDVLFVGKCGNYVKIPPRKERPLSERMEAKKTLADFLYS